MYCQDGRDELVHGGGRGPENRMFGFGRTARTHSGERRVHYGSYSRYSPATTTQETVIQEYHDKIAAKVKGQGHQEEELICTTKY